MKRRLRIFASEVVDEDYTETWRVAVDLRVRRGCSGTQIVGKAVSAHVRLFHVFKTSDVLLLTKTHDNLLCKESFSKTTLTLTLTLF